MLARAEASGNVLADNDDLTGEFVPLLETRRLSYFQSLTARQAAVRVILA